MRRWIDGIFELIFYIQKLDDGDKTAFKQFISKYRSGKALLNMLKEFEKSDPYEPKGFLYKLIRNQNSRDYKTYLRFKKHLFEFEVSSKRINFFKKDDLNLYLHNYLMKELIAANILTERNAYSNAIQSLNETYKKAEKYELMEIQKPCAKYLTQFYQYTTQKDEYESWNDKAQEISEAFVVYEKRIDHFEKTVHQLNCCIMHPVYADEQIQEEGSFKPTLRLKKMAWMALFLNTKRKFQDQNYQGALNQCFEMNRIMEEDPGIFPQHYKLIIYIVMAETLWFLGRFSVVESLSYKIGRLDVFAMHQRIPALYMGLCYFLKKNRFEHIELVCEQVDHVMGYHHFKEYVARVRMIEMMALFKQNNFVEFLKKFNRSNQSISDLCCFNTFLLKSLEICCIKELKDENALFDKLEAFRRYISRNDQLHKNPFCKLIYKTLKIGEISHQEQLNAFNTHIQQAPIYDLKWMVVDYLLANCLTFINLNGNHVSTKRQDPIEQPHLKKAQ